MTVYSPYNHIAFLKRKHVANGIGGGFIIESVNIPTVLSAVYMYTITKTSWGVESYRISSYD